MPITIVHRAAYNRPNPNLICGRKSQPGQHIVKPAIARVFLTDCVNYVARIKVTMDVAREISLSPNCDYTPEQIRQRIATGKPVPGLWNGKRASFRPE